MKGISDQDHEHAQKVWNRIIPVYKNATLGDDHEVLTTDVLLQADVFVTIPNTRLDQYKLDPAHF